MYYENEIIGFCGVIHQPNKDKTLKRVTRLVILPDYQGIGLGTRFLTLIAKKYKNNGNNITIVTSAKNLIKSLKKNKEWIMIRYSSNNMEKDYGGFKKTVRNNCKTASFFYKGS